ncbi:hypothetical protein [Streptomyces sp. EMB24]|uniref:hypothetical protein n=1 Tax=Streptomyces sp. EMB24 TaxID=2835531 RepID=UPI00227AF28C|nr:hypothetical protein [Streptomyces sp. EMB24]
MKANLGNAVAEVRTVLEQVHALVPNATTSLVGYPLLFSRTQARSSLVSASQRVILNDVAVYFEGKQREIALSRSASHVR